MADEKKRIINETTDTALASSGDYVIVDSQTEGTRKFDLGAALAAEVTARDAAIAAEASARSAADTEISADVSQLKEDLSEVTVATRNINTATMGRFNNTSGGNIYPQNDLYYGMDQFISIEPNTTYAISQGGISSSEQIGLTILIVDSDGNVLSRSGYVNATARAITTPATADRIHVFYKSTSTITISDNAYCQIEKGSSATSYIPPYTALDYEAREELSAAVVDITKKMGFVRQILANEDIHDIRDIGIYQAIYSRVSSYSNYPSLSAGLLIVFPGTSAIVHMLVDTNNVIYTEYATSTTWSEWVKHPLTSDIDALIDAKIDNYLATDGAEW